MQMRYFLLGVLVYSFYGSLILAQSKSDEPSPRTFGLLSGQGLGNLLGGLIGQPGYGYGFPRPYPPYGYGYGPIPLYGYGGYGYPPFGTGYGYGFPGPFYR